MIGVTGYEWLREGLLVKHMRQKDLADQLHVSESTVQKWCVGKHAIPADRIPEISCILELSPFLLMGLDVNDDTPYRVISLKRVIPNENIMKELHELPVTNGSMLYDMYDVFQCRWFLQHGNKSLDRDQLLFDANNLLDIYSQDAGFSDVLAWFEKHEAADDLFLEVYQNVNLFEHVLALSLNNLEQSVLDDVLKHGIIGHPRVFCKAKR